jgi:alkyldihydroxyacetonephosphate synthase
LDLADDLARSLGAVVSKSEADRAAYARDLWPRHHIDVRAGEVALHKPAAIVWPRTTEEVASIVARCAAEGTPLVPYGAGSGVCGGVLPDARAVILDLKKLSAVRKLDRETPLVDVEAGALGIRFEEDLQAQGFTLGHFPSSILCSTVGGWVAARSAGQCSGLYGKIEDMIISLECVVGRGEVVRLHRRTHGPDLVQLVTGSEGILGVVTAAELRLHPAPQQRAFCSFSFPTVEAGWEAMREMFQAGLRPAVCRLYDAFDSFMARRGSVRGSRRGAPQSPGGLAKSTKNAALRLLLRAPSVMNRLVDTIGDRAFGGAMLILVLEGDEATHREDLARIRHVAARLAGRELGEGPARHWLSHRYSVSYRQAPVFMAGAFSDTMEVAAPWSRLADLYREVRRAMGRHVFVMAHLSHAYADGCSIYFTFAGSAPTREATLELYDATWRAALAACIEAGGTLSHHHGVGRSKAPRLGAELGLGVEVVRSLARTFDPASIFNPGNLLPAVRPHRPAHTERLPEPGAPVIDETSLLVHANGATLLGDLEDLAHGRGFTLQIADLDRRETVARFIARGMPGAPDPYDDPADHAVAGFRATLGSGEHLTVRPSPRRAVGPDLFALFLGLDERVGRIDAAHLRLHRTGLGARPLPCRVERNPGIGAAERLLLEAVVKETRGTRYEG